MSYRPLHKTVDILKGTFQFIREVVEVVTGEKFSEAADIVSKISRYPTLTEKEDESIE